MQSRFLPNVGTSRKRHLIVKKKFKDIVQIYSTTGPFSQSTPTEYILPNANIKKRRISSTLYKIPIQKDESTKEVLLWAQGTVMLQNHRGHCTEPVAGNKEPDRPGPGIRHNQTDW